MFDFFTKKHTKKENFKRSCDYYERVIGEYLIKAIFLSLPILLFVLFFIKITSPEMITYIKSTDLELLKLEQYKKINEIIFFFGLLLSPFSILMIKSKLFNDIYNFDYNRKDKENRKSLIKSIVFCILSSVICLFFISNYQLLIVIETILLGMILPFIVTPFVLSIILIEPRFRFIYLKLKRKYCKLI